MKIYVNEPGENWIIDRVAGEWKRYNSEITTDSAEEAEVIWILAPWCWDRIPLYYLQTRKVVCTIHHVVPDKFDNRKKSEFLFRDKFVDMYNVTNAYTEEFLRTLTDKPIKKIGYWCDPKLWFELDKQKCREELNLPKQATLIGSFQRDTEGHDLVSPKLEKGPDIFCDMVEKYHEENSEVQVVLAGWRRQYVINRLEKKGIKYYYYERVDNDIINKLYNSLDLYVVSSRCEGGPQALLECAITRTPIISTDVGMAKNVLSEKSIFYEDASDAEPDLDTAYEKIQNYLIPGLFEKYVDMFKEVLK